MFSGARYKIPCAYVGIQISIPGCMISNFITFRHRDQGRHYSMVPYHPTKAWVQVPCEAWAMQIPLPKCMVANCITFSGRDQGRHYITQKCCILSNIFFFYYHGALSRYQGMGSGAMYGCGRADPIAQKCCCQILFLIIITFVQVEIKADIMVPYHATKAWGQVPCEDGAMRIPMLECMITNIITFFRSKQRQTLW
jgi:hypothetical protein